MDGDEQLEANHTIASFTDLDRLAAQVAGAVKRWCRQVPLRKGGARVTIRLDATWNEREHRPKKE